MKNILNLKLVVFLEYQNIKMFLQKALIEIVLKRLLWLKKLKILCRGLMLLMILTTKKLFELFTKKNCKKKNQKEFRIDKVIKKNGENLYVKWKGYNNSFNNCIDKKHSINEWIFSKTEIFRSKCKSWIRFV